MFQLSSTLIVGMVSGPHNVMAAVEGVESTKKCENLSEGSETTNTSPYPRSRKVAVIGAGAAGLTAARELLREGHEVSVFEQMERVGGTWVYDPNVDSDLLGTIKNRKRVHSSMYASLRTNLCRDLMSFTEFTFLPKGGRDSRRFPGHAEVASYLQDYAEFYGLLEYIHLSTVVEYAGVHEERGETVWKVRTRRNDKVEGVNEEIFDAVVVCNGHNSEPRIASISGISKWPGRQIHSHNYREPHPFTDQIVVVIGNAPSGDEISREIATVAKEVHISGRTWNTPVDFLIPKGPRSNIWCHSVVEFAFEDGSIKFEDGGIVRSDVIVHCTGYSFSFPFLDTGGKLFVDNNYIQPLYKHVFVPALAPSLSFVGVPWKVIPFQMFEHQSRWIAMAISGKVQLPSSEEMSQSVETFHANFEATGKPKYLAHSLYPFQNAYIDWIADQTGSAHVETWRREMTEVCWINKNENPDTYRDIWPDEDLHQEAYSYFKKVDVTSQ